MNPMEGDLYRQFIYYRTYSRFNDALGRRETWPETVDRYMNFMRKTLSSRYSVPSLKKAYDLTEQEYGEIRDAILKQEVMPSMRLMWAAGPTAEKCNAAGYNCSYLSIESFRDIAETLYLLCSGTGVGFGVEKNSVDKLPVIVKQRGVPSSVFVVADSKEGWADALLHGLNTWASGGDVVFDYSQVRPAGARLKTMGGRASGPGPLIELLELTKKIVLSRQGEKLRTIDVHDIMTKVGDIVVSGGVRRSAMISLSDLDDDDIRHAKDGRFWERNPHRALANNSAVYNEKPTKERFAEEWAALRASNSGERGIFNRGSLKKQVPARRWHKWTELGVTIPSGPGKNIVQAPVGTNPCGEIHLIPRQFCNLTEVVAREDDTNSSLERKARIASIIGTFQSTLTDFKYLNDSWRRNCEAERLLGVSITGQWDSPVAREPDSLRRMRDIVVETNKKYATRFNITQSTATTCVKPSGCQVKETMLSTDRGILSLEEIGDTDGETWQPHEVSVSTKDGLERSTKFFVNGLSKTKKIKLRSGLTVEATPDHRYRIFDGRGLVWKRAGDLLVGDCLPYRVGDYSGGEDVDLYEVKSPYWNTKKIKQPRKLSKSLAWLLGLYFGDGSNHSKGIRIAGGVKDIGILEQAKEIARKEFGINGIIYSRTKGLNADLYLNSTHLLAWMGANGLLKQRSGSIEVPRKIRVSKKEIVLSFIDGYWNADGCEMKNGQRSFVTISKRMAEQVVICLRACGQDASVRLMPPTESSWGTKMRYWISTKRGRDGDYKRSPDGETYKQLDSCGLHGLTPDFVADISDGEAPTFDIEVPVGNEYLANGYISHNTVSQLVDASSGLHTRFSSYYIRRVRITATDPLFKMLRDQGVPYSPEVGQDPLTAHTFVLEFPVKAPEGAKTGEDHSAVAQLKHWLVLKQNWTEHNPSCTIFIKEHEWDEVRDWVWDHWDSVGGLSFLPFSDSVYEKAPYESISKKKYDELKAAMPEIDFSALARYENEDNTEGAKSLACVSGVCAIEDAAPVDKDSVLT